MMVGPLLLENTSGAPSHFLESREVGKRRILESGLCFHVSKSVEGGTLYEVLDA